MSIPGISIKGESKCSTTPQIVQRQNRYGFLPKSSNAPILCAACGTRTKLYANHSMSFSLSDIQLATNDFSKDNLLGEGGYGCVYKVVLWDGQQIAAKVRKEESTQGFSEFHSEVCVKFCLAQEHSDAAGVLLQEKAKCSGIWVYMQ